MWLHSHVGANPASSSAIGRLTVPFFCFIAGVFLVHALRGRAAEETRPFLRRRAARLYVPFVIWTVIYALARLGGSLLTDKPHGLSPSLDWFAVGTMHHLWFLPFLLLATVLFAWPLRAVLPHPGLARSLAAMLIVGGAAMTLYPILVYPTGRMEVVYFEHFHAKWAEESASDLDWTYFVDRVWSRSPGFMWGVAAGILLGANWRRLRLGAWGVALGGAACVGSIAWYWATGRNPVAANVGGVGLVALGMGLGSSALTRRLAPLGALTYGIYLVHILIVLGIWTFARMVKADARPWVGEVVFVLALAGSVAITWLARRWRVGRWAFP